MAASFAVFSLAVLIWATPGGRVIEGVRVQQFDPAFSTLNACRDDLENKITPRLASAARVVADAVKASVHFGVAGDHLIAARDVVRCLAAPASADVLEGLNE
jgi:hypothetical protein